MMKRSLVLSGGGSRGSYQVGAIQALLEGGRTWNSIHGISVGTLNGSWLAMHSQYEQPQCIHGLLDIWNNINNTDDIFTRWNPIKPVNYLYSMWKGSLHSGQPLERLVDKFLDISRLKNSGVKFTIGCVNLNSSEYVVLDQTSENMKAFILASSHLPLVFEPIDIYGERWVDGGIRHQIPILEALKERPDEIDVILTSPITTRDRILPATNLTSAPRVALRASEIMSDQIYLMDCYTVLRAARTLENVKINVYIPSISPNQNSMDFNKENIQAGIKLGYDETLAKLMQKIDIDDSDLDF